MPGRQGICALRNPIPLAGAPTSLGLPPRHLLFSFTFLLVVSRQGRVSRSPLKEPALEPTSSSSAVVAGFGTGVNKIPLPIRGGGVWQIETVQALRRGRPARARLAHGLIVSGTSL